jgi:hypothetical protein
VRALFRVFRVVRGSVEVRALFRVFRVVRGSWK